MFSVAVMLLLAAGSCVDSLDLIQPDSLVVQPGQSLTITCQVSGYSLTDGNYATGWIRQREGKAMDWISHQWGGSSGSFYQNDALKNKFSYSRDTSAGTVTVRGQNLQPEDSAVYYCVRRPWGSYYAFDYWGKGTTVTVTSATTTGPTVFPLVPCGSGAGDKVTVACLATGFTPPSLTFKWTKGGTAMSDFIVYPPVQKNSVYTGVSQIQVSKADWDSQAFVCSVEHPGGNKQTDVAKPKPAPTTPPPPMIFQLPTLVGGISASADESEVTFSCFAKEFAAKTHEFKWLSSDKDVTGNILGGIFNTKNTVNGTFYSAASFLTVTTPTNNDYTCKFVATNEKEEINSINVTLTQKNNCPGDTQNPNDYVEVNIIPPTLQDILVKKRGTVVCQVTEKLPTVEKIYWENDKGKEIPATKAPFPNGNKKAENVSIEITFDEWSQGAKFSCIVEHKHLIEPVSRSYERIPGLVFDRPSVFMLPPVEHTKNEVVTLTCFVKDFYPQDLYVAWLVDDEAADSKYDFYTTNAVESNGSYFAYSHLTLSLTQWLKTGVVYSCAVYHESLTNATNTIVRSTGYNTYDKTNLVNLNLNIPHTCKA